MTVCIMIKEKGVLYSFSRAYSWKYWLKILVDIQIILKTNLNFLWMLS